MAAVDTCNEHSFILHQFEQFTVVLKDNTAAVNRLVEKLNTMATTNSKFEVEIAHAKAELDRVRKCTDDQWSAINALRAKVYIGVGLALAGSTAATLFAGLIGK